MKQPAPELRHLHLPYGALLLLLGLVSIGQHIFFPKGLLLQPMTLVGAVAVLMMGTALVSLGRGWDRLSRYLAYASTLVCLGYAALYLGIGRLLGLVEFVYQPDIAVPVRHTEYYIAPMGVLVLLCGNLLLLAMGRPRPRHGLVLGLGSALLVLCLLSLSSHFIALETVSYWWRFMSLTVTASIGSLVGVLWVMTWLLRAAALQENTALRSGVLLVVAVVLIAVIGSVSYASNAELVASSGRLIQTHEVVGAVDRFVSEVARMESSARGYIMTGEAPFRARVKDHADEIEAKLLQLYQLTAENLVEQKQVERLRGLTDGKHRFIAELLRAYDAQGPEAAARLLSREPNTVGSALVRTADTIRQGAYDLLSRRQHDMEAMQLGARRVQLFAGSLALCLILLAYALEFQANAARLRAERQLREANESLESRVVARTVELQQAVTLLSDREHSLRFLADAMPQLVWTTQADGTPISFNRTWCVYTGLTEEESLGGTWTRPIHPDDLPEAQQLLRSVRATGQEGGGQVRLRRAADGAYRWMLWRIRPEVSAEGRLVRWVGTLTDIHDQKAAAEVLEERVRLRTQELAEVTRLQRGVLDGTVFSVIATDTAGIITEFNRAAEEMLGYRREEMVGLRSPAQFHDPAEVAARAAALTQELGRPVAPGFGVFTALPQLGRTDEREWAYVRKDGGRLPVLLTITALHDQEGAITGYLGLAQDLTERKRTEDALRTSERRLREAQQLAQLGHWEFSAGNREQEWWSDEMYRIYGLEPDGKPVSTGQFQRLIHPEDRDRVRAETEKLIQAGSELRLQYRILRADGEERHLLDVIEAVRDPEGRLQLVRGVVQDITERQRLLDHLAQARDEALEASRLKSEFLANISHELRTPMNGIIGMSSLLVETTLDHSQREMTQVIQSSAESLLAIISDILDFSQIEAGKLRIEAEVFNLRELVEQTVLLLAARAHSKGIEVVCDYPTGLPEVLEGDAGRIRQILTNLLGNALKFTEQGEVLLTVSAAAPAGAGPARMRFEVRDTGIGIPRSQQNRLFQAFSQIDGTHTRRYGGTGLGLAICRQLVELMHGQIGFSSEERRGSTFWFQLDLPVRPDAGPAPSHEIPRGLRVLAVDDNATNRRILARQLAELGVDAVFAEAATPALQLFRAEAAAGRALSAALLDWNMPDTDGVALAQALRAEPGAAQLPLLLLSSSGQSLDAATAARLQFTAVLTKPVRPAQLRAGLARIRTAGVTLPGAETPAATPRSGHRVLVAEDNEANQIVIRRYMEKLGHEAVIVPDGQAALEELARGRYDAILMDCQMPRVDGYEATRRIRSGELPGVPARIPIIALTAYAQPTDRLKCLSAGMDDYLSKPVRFEGLIEALRRAGVGPTAAATPAAEPAAPPPPPAVAAAPVLDEGQLQQLRDLPGRKHATLLLDLLDIFLKEAPPQWAQLQDRVRERHRDQTVMLSHRLAGSCANVGGLTLRKLLLQCEQLAKAESWSELEPALAAAAQEWHRVLDALEALRPPPAA